MYEWQNDMTSMGRLNTANNVVNIKFPSGSWKLVKLENVEYLAYC